MALRFPLRGISIASDRAIVKMAETMNLDAIAKETGRTPESILRTARRLSLSIKLGKLTSSR
jgi:hypothetical protein